MVFYKGKWQVERRSSPGIDAVEVRFRGSKGDQGRKGGVLVRTTGDWSKGGEAVELLQELHRIHEGRLDLPLMAYRNYGGWNPLLAPGIVNSGRGMGKGRGRREGMIGYGGIRTTHREDWGCDEVGGDGGESNGDIAASEVVAQCVYGVREG